MITAWFLICHWNIPLVSVQGFEKKGADIILTVALNIVLLSRIFGCCTHRITYPPDYFTWQVIFNLHGWTLSAPLIIPMYIRSCFYLVLISFARQDYSEYKMDSRILYHQNSRNPETIRINSRYDENLLPAGRRLIGNL